MDKWIEQYCNYMFPIEATEKEMENAKKLQAENIYVSYPCSKL